MSERILDGEGNPLRLERPTGREVDLAALLILNINDEITINPFDISPAGSDMFPQVAMPVSINGFPLELTSIGAFPI